MVTRHGKDLDMTLTSGISRRRFLQGMTAAGLAGPAIITSSLWSKPNGKPKDTLRSSV
jgi:hypothetical protein